MILTSNGWNLLILLISILFAQSEAGRSSFSDSDIPDFLKLVLPDTHLNPDSIFADKRVWSSRLGQRVPGQVAELTTFAIRELPKLNPLQGSPKTDVLESMNSILKDYLVDNKTGLPEGYLFFGPKSLNYIGDETLGVVREVIALLLKTNAFYASALSSDTINGPVKLQSNSNNNWFGRFIKGVNETYPRVDVIFDDNLYLASWKCYTLDESEELPSYFNCTELEAYEILSVNINFYSQCLHTNLHTYQYIMGSALAHAADISLATNAFATPYMLNLQSTYNDVVNLDLREGGVLVGGLFSSDRKLMLQLLRDVLAAWGSYYSANDFVNKFLFGGFKTTALPLRLNLLEEFRKHVSLYDPFARAVTNYMSKDSRYQLSKVNHRIKEYLKGTGNGLSRTPSLKIWLELMSVTGLMHGQTMSFTRYMCTKISFSKFLPTDTFGSSDRTYWRATAPTIIGAQPNRQQFQRTIFSSESVWYDPLLGDVMDPFAQQAAQLKQQYLEYITEEEGLDFLKNYGWIVADYFPEGWDGRQLTLTTYF